MPFAKLMAEMVGTFALIVGGCGAIMVESMQPGILGHGGVCAAFGLVIMVMIFATGHISGAHFNPAVSIAFAAAGRFPWREVPAYIVAQFLAAILGALCLKALLGDVGSLGATQVAPTLSFGAAYAIEIVFTFFLMFTIISVATDSRSVGQLAGLGIGGTVTLAALVAGPLTGASMNPARTLGPALISGEMDHLILYMTAPVIGAVLGALVYSRIRCDEARTSETATQNTTDAAGCC